MTDTSTSVAGSTFDIPGVPGQTQWFDQYEDTYDLAFTPSSSVQAPVLGIADFRRTDVVLNWRHHFLFSACSFTAGTGQTLTTSDYAPYNYIGPVKLQIQNQYASVDVENGIDLFIFNLVRPFNRSAQRNNNYANPAGGPINADTTGWLSTLTTESNLIVPSAQWTKATSAFDLILDVPGGCWFDEYYAIGVDGSYQGAMADTFVSPQFMAGTQRLIKTAIQTNPLLGATTDIAPVQTTSATATTDTASTAKATLNLNIRRQGVYGNNSASSLPAPQPWQYRWKTQRFGINGKTNVIVQVPDDTGQVLFTYLRLFDPSAASGVGAPIALSNLASASNAVTLQYGSGLTWFQGTAEEMQALWLDKHGFILPVGVLAFDFAIDENNRFTNRRALNTLTTAGIEWVLNFTSATSSTAYAVLGTESLVYVV